MSIRLGASPTSPGVVCRWRHECCGEHATLWRGEEPIGAVVREGGTWLAFGDMDQEAASRWPQRWQAKRAVEAMASDAMRGEAEDWETVKERGIPAGASFRGYDVTCDVYRD